MFHPSAHVGRDHCPHFIDKETVAPNSGFLVVIGLVCEKACMWTRILVLNEMKTYNMRLVNFSFI